MTKYPPRDEKKLVDQEGDFWHPHFQMTKDQLISLIKKILGTDVDLKFLPKLDLAELKILVSLIRERIENERHYGDMDPLMK